MAYANSTAAAEPFHDCACANAHRDLLQQNEIDVRDWARQIVSSSEPSEAGFVPCPPFPVAPSFHATCAVSCVQAEEASHE